MLDVSVIVNVLKHKLVEVEFVLIHVLKVVHALEQPSVLHKIIERFVNVQLDLLVILSLIVSRVSDFKNYVDSLLSVVSGFLLRLIGT